MDIQSRFDMFEPGDRTALVCIDEPELQHTVVDQLNVLGYKIHTGLFSEDVSLKLKAHQYDVVVIYESFSNSDLESNTALSEVAAMSPSERRMQFVVLLGPNFVTNDSMQAFEHSVDLVCSISEVFSFGPLLRRATDRHEAFYREFKACLGVLSSL